MHLLYKHKILTIFTGAKCCLLPQGNCCCYCLHIVETSFFLFSHFMFRESNASPSSSTSTSSSARAPDQLRKGHVFATIPSMQGVSYHAVYVRHPPRDPSLWSNTFGLNRQTPVQLVILFSLPPSRDLLVNVASGRSQILLKGQLLRRTFFSVQTKRKNAGKNPDLLAIL